MDPKIVLITQARVGSTRLPSKVLKEIEGNSILKIHLSRILNSKLIDKIIVATTDKYEEYPIVDLCRKLNIDVFQGSEYDVLDRFYKSVINCNADWIVRVTSDCPLIDPILIDYLVNAVVSSGKDYGSNTMVESYPDGQDIEVFKFFTLKKAWENAKIKSEREHVTPYIKNYSDIMGGHEFTSLSIENIENYSNVRMTVDEALDFEAIKILLEKLGYNAGWKDYADYILQNEYLFLNQGIIRNEGYLKSLRND
jgi:spore coat polysaccharide biosynthesis protein SpsF